MTQEDWKKAEEKCSGLFGRCTLRVDGRRVDIAKEPVKDMAVRRLRGEDIHE